MAAGKFAGTSNAMNVAGVSALSCAMKPYACLTTRSQRCTMFEFRPCDKATSPTHALAVFPLAWPTAESPLSSDRLVVSLSMVVLRCLGSAQFS